MQQALMSMPPKSEPDEQSVESPSEVTQEARLAQKDRLASHAG
jgi:hypothetical protein